MLKIIRNDIVKMRCDAIVNTANSRPTYGDGIDKAVYEAAGADELLAVRQKIGFVKEGEVFMTDAFNLPAKKIIHAVSPLYRGGKSGEEKLLRACYKKSLQLAKKNGLKSVAFPLISTGSFGYPMEEGMRIAVDEINDFLKKNEDFLIYLVVFGERATDLGRQYTDDLDSYINRHYVDDKTKYEYGDVQHALYSVNACRDNVFPAEAQQNNVRQKNVRQKNVNQKNVNQKNDSSTRKNLFPDFLMQASYSVREDENCEEASDECSDRNADGNADKIAECLNYDEDIEKLESGLAERTKHLKDSFSDYLQYLVRLKNMKGPEVYNRAIVSKKVYSKMINDPKYHPSKEVALQLCVGAKLNIDETRDLLARAGYALSPSSLMDVIFEFFIENGHYNMVDIDIEFEEYGLDCIIK